MEIEERKKIIETKIKPLLNIDIKYLGSGFESLVYYYNDTVYKIFISKDYPENILPEWKFAFLKSKINLLTNAKYLYQLRALFKIDNIHILSYKFDSNFEKMKYISENEAISFLSECYRERIIFTDIGLGNFIRVNDIPKYIDYSPINMVEYSDNLFLNMCARAYIDVKFGKDDNYQNKKIIKRSSINNFNIPELEDFQDFLNKVFSNIIFEESEIWHEKIKENIIEIKSNKSLLNTISGNDCFYFTNFEDLNLEKLFWELLSKNIRLISIIPSNFKLNSKLYHEPEFYKIETKKLNKTTYKVSLLIKTCPQESNTIYQQVKHIIKQLSSPDVFYEKVIAIDKKENNFLRQYNNNGSLKRLYSEINSLISEKIIDYYIELPEDKIIETNYRWFNLKTKETHNIDNIPVTPQLYAFEQVKGDYILQMDADVLIGRQDYNHSFLNDMLSEFDKNDKVISVGFNIPKDRNIDFLKYHAPKNGGFVPEVRFGLFHKQRLLDLRPLPNELINNKLKLSWYRSLHIHQKNTGYTSLRGGSPKSYYIHPQNYRKKCKDVWFTILDRVENNQIPELQREEFDLTGSYYNWALPKRGEELIIITLVHNVEYNRFLRTWNSIISQTYNRFGWIIIDDASDNGLPVLIENLINESNLKNKTTFIKNRFQQGYLSNTYKAIHYFCDNPNSIITIIDGDDALIGKNTLSEVYKKYQNGADVTVGKMYRTDKLYAHYPYNPNFTNPRLTGGNVWQHLRTFKKYLFDSINLPDLKHDKLIDALENKYIKNRFEWFKYCADFAYMVPIVEMAQNPMRLERYNYYHERSTPATKGIKVEKEKIIAEILNRPKYSKQNVVKGNRINFLTNLNKIEIDITYNCDLKCISCNRSCRQAPSNDYISLNQIEMFIKESIELNKKWEFINILGGEPTLHHHFEKIIKLVLNEYIYKFSKDTILQITSNGYTNKSRNLLKQFENISNIQIDYNSFKNSNKVEYFTPFNIAPIDTKEFSDEDFSKGCWVTSYCGIGFNKYGYYPCGVAAGIDRVIGLDIGIKSLKDLTQKRLKQLLNTFCKYCGNFIDYKENSGNFIPRCEKSPLKENKISEIWEKLYKDFKTNKPQMTNIYE